jgi:hypothetical protein
MGVMLRYLDSHGRSTFLYLVLQRIEKNSIPHRHDLAKGISLQIFFKNESAKINHCFSAESERMFIKLLCSSLHSVLASLIEDIIFL